MLLNISTREEEPKKKEERWLAKFIPPASSLPSLLLGGKVFPVEGGGERGLSLSHTLFIIIMIVILEKLFGRKMHQNDSQRGSKSVQ